MGLRDDSEDLRDMSINFRGYRATPERAEPQGNSKGFQRVSGGPRRDASGLRMFQGSQKNSEPL